MIFTTLSFYSNRHSVFMANFINSNCAKSYANKCELLVFNLNTCAFKLIIDEYSQTKVNVCIICHTSRWYLKHVAVLSFYVP